MLAFYPNVYFPPDYLEGLFAAKGCPGCGSRRGRSASPANACACRGSFFSANCINMLPKSHFMACLCPEGIFFQAEGYSYGIFPRLAGRREGKRIFLPGQRRDGSGKGRLLYKGAIFGKGGNSLEFVSIGK